MLDNRVIFDYSDYAEDSRDFDRTVTIWATDERQLGTQVVLRHFMVHEATVPFVRLKWVRYMMNTTKT